MTEPAQTLTIDIVSDVMCPWCYIGKKNLEAAAGDIGGIALEVRWRPYQLDPTLPKEGKDRAAYLNEKFGGEEKARQIYERVNQAGKVAGIDFRFDDIAVSPNTLDAHRLIRWAGGVSQEAQDAVVTRLFQLYFEEGANIGDPMVLSAVAEGAGLDGAIVRELLASDRDREEVQREVAQARSMGVTGVPCFIIAGRFGVMGAQPPDSLSRAIRAAAEQIAQEKAAGGAAQG
jgi:predicted DsbA family dithiol-disulfide isomerase